MTPAQLLAAPGDWTIGSLKLAKPRTVSQGVPLRALVSDEHYRGGPVAVVDPSGKLVGLLTEDTLRTVEKPKAPQARNASAWRSIGELYWCGMGRLLGDAIAVQSRVRSNQRGESCLKLALKSIPSSRRTSLSGAPTKRRNILKDMAPQEAADVVAAIDPRVLSNAFRTLSLAKALDILESTEPLAGGALLLHLAPARAGAVLEGLTEAKREEILERMSPADSRELRILATYQPDSAGRLRDPRIHVFRTTTSVADALARLKIGHKGRSLLNLFVVDDDGGLVGTVPLHEAVVADPGDSLLSLVRQPPLAVSPFASRSEIVETMRRHRLASLPVVGPQNTPIGVLRLNDLIEEVEKELSSDLLSMTGASKEESALSGPGFAVRKRLPWLQVNLATAFLAAAVVGFFEDTIARFTALAVLLPVVAGQSGNTAAKRSRWCFGDSRCGRSPAGTCQEWP